MKYSIAILTFIFFSMNIVAQKQAFDVVSFSAPKGWQQQQNEGGLQFSVTDKKTGGYAIILITKATASQGTANENFNSDWNRIVKGAVQVNDEPTMQEAVKDNGWDIISGTANYMDGNQKGLATLITATGGGQMTSALLMTNTDTYQNELLAFINSMELAKASPGTNLNKKTDNTNTTNNSSVVGMWVFYNTESSGTYNGFPQLTGGYMRREYVFYGDGTYLFRAKDWLVYVKDILFVYETGTYTVSGNQITITPKKGKGEWWSKAASGRTSEWGKLVRASTDYKLEKTTYTFDFDQYKGNDEITLILKSAKSTERDGGDKTGTQQYLYKSRELNKSLIDNPPGFKTGFEGKSVNATPVENKKSSEQAATNKATINKELLGSWSYSAKENYYGSLSPGYSIKQYTFNEDGTYTYLHKFFSSTINNLIFQYETGNYTVNGKQLIITALAGANEEWSKNKTHPDKWNSKLKTNKRKLEKTTYSFTLHYYSGINETNLILQAGNPTEREGSFSNIADYPKGWAFKPCNTNNNPPITTPPGFAGNAENKQRPSASFDKINSSLSGKVWEAQSLEKYGAAYGSMSGFYTGGFWLYQYKFNADGTYQFVYNAASALATNPVQLLQYESGTYTVNGNSITITPVNGANEEWSVGKINNGMSAEYIRQVLETKVKRLKTSARKLEKTTYVFTVEYWQGNNANALCLKHTQNTVREGSPGQNNQSCFFETKTSSLIFPSTLK